MSEILSDYPINELIRVLGKEPEIILKMTPTDIISELILYIKKIEELEKSKQDLLVSGENIKTINGSSILGEGDLAVSGGSSSGSYSDLTDKPQIGGIELSGNKTLKELGIQPEGNYATSEDLGNIDKILDNINGEEIR